MSIDVRSIVVTCFQRAAVCSSGYIIVVVCAADSTALPVMVPACVEQAEAEKRRLQQEARLASVDVHNVHIKCAS